MASSRWKRFAFFDRQTYQLDPDVMEDLLSNNPDSSTSATTASSTTEKSSIRTLQKQANTTASVALTVTTAALPSSVLLQSNNTAATSSSGGGIFSTPQATTTSSNNNKPYETTPIHAMWNSLTACHYDAATISTSNESNASFQMPNQAGTGITSTGKSSSSSSSVLDGLVLVFCASSKHVHCFDMTVRCNPPYNSSNNNNSENNESITSAVSEDQDGWRGYFTPYASSSNFNDSSIIALASCRASVNSTNKHSPVLLACLTNKRIGIFEDPHLYLSCTKPLTVKDLTPKYTASWGNAATSSDGKPCALDIHEGMVAVGTSKGVVCIYTNKLKQCGRIPAPPNDSIEVVSVRLSKTDTKVQVFVAYKSDNTEGSSSGLCCYDLPLPNQQQQQQQHNVSSPSARHDLDGRYVGSSSLVDAIRKHDNNIEITVARPDGLYTYSPTERTGVAPIDGSKLAICLVPPANTAEHVEADQEESRKSVSSGYALVASTDAKSGRDAVDIYDATNKLVAFHLLLSPGHRALRAAGTTTPSTRYQDGSLRGGRSSAICITSGGSIISFTEKLTQEKIALLVQKNLYSAAIVVAYADPSYEPSEITALYQQCAEHLYRKGDFSGAIDQYMHTIGSLESSRVIFRYLDAPKIPLLVKYLEKLRERELATPVHNELLRTCYLKLNDMQAAEAIAVSSSQSITDASLESILSNLSAKPKEALATICSLEAQHAADVLVVHGASLARALPRETAGVVIALCVGTYTPRALAEVTETLSAAAATTNAAAADLNKLVTHHHENVVIEPYPVALFASAFVEHPKILRLVLAHCNRNKCPLTPSLRRTLLELTLSEWNQAKRSGDTEAEKLRHKEAIAALTDSHCSDIGDYEALVIVQLAGFEEGELLLYERLQMTPMLLERYAKDGTEKSRRQMLAMCQTDPEVLADVLGYFVEIASEKLGQNESRKEGDNRDDISEDDEVEEIMDDIQEALTLARRQGVLPPVRIARILAGEGTGQFSTDILPKEKKKTVPLSVALDYVGTILEDSRKEATRLKAEIEEYNQLCNSMESQIDSLLRSSCALPPLPDDDDEKKSVDRRLNIDELYVKVKSDETSLSGEKGAVLSDQAREAFWREMNQTEDSFDTIARFFAKGVLG